MQVVHLHPVEEGTPVATFADASLAVHDDGDPIFDHLAGEGTPVVAERAVVELAAALDMAYRSGCNLVADSLELCYRLPRLMPPVGRAGKSASVKLTFAPQERAPVRDGRVHL